MGSERDIGRETDPGIPIPGNLLFDERGLTAAAAFYDDLTAVLNARLLELQADPEATTEFMLSEAQRILLEHVGTLTAVLGDAQLAAFIGGAGSVVAGLSPLENQPPPVAREVPAPLPSQASQQPAPSVSDVVQAFEQLLQQILGRKEPEAELVPAPQVQHAFPPVSLPPTPAKADESGVPPTPEAPPSPPPPPLPPVDVTISGNWEWPGMQVWLPLIEEATKDIQSRQLMTRTDFDQASQEERQKAFTVAYQATVEAIEPIHKAIVEAVAEGTGQQEFTTKVDEALGASTLGPGHLENVFRTNIQSAYSRGMDKILDHPLVTDEFPYEEVLPIRDSRLTHLCEVIAESGIMGPDGKRSAIFRRDDPVYIKFKSPRHWQDRCGRRALRLQDAAAAGIEEAKKWLETGLAPAQPAWVPHPSVELPKGWVVGGQIE